MRYFPAFVDLKNGACLVVGGGPAALAKLRILIRSEARLTVVAPDVVPEIAELARQGRLAWHAKRFEASDLDGQTLVFTATGIDAVDGGRIRGVITSHIGGLSAIDTRCPTIADGPQDPLCVGRVDADIDVEIRFDVAIEDIDVLDCTDDANRARCG